MATISLDGLLARGDTVAVERGRLTITPASGKPVPPTWLAQHGPLIVAQAARQVGSIPLTYVSYSVGNYGKHLAGGVTLQFVELDSQQQFYTVFNAETKRKRTTPAGKAGANLPTGQFRVGKLSAFAQFWIRTGLPYQRLSSVHRRMGRLAEITFVAEPADCERLIATTLRPLEVERMGNNRGLTDKQSVNKLRTADVNNKTRQNQLSRDFHGYPSAGGNSYGNTVKGDTGKGGVVIPLPTVKNSSNEDWLRDYESEPGCTGSE